MSTHLAFTHDADVAHIRLTRAEAGNRLTNAMAAAMAQALDACRDARLVTLRGDGADFCIGRDMQPPPPGSQARPADVMREDAAPMLELLGALRRSRAPLLALVQGRAWGIGTVFAALADIAIATPDATFRLAELERGIPPTLALSVLVDRVPRKTLSRMVLTAATLDAGEAVTAGLASQIVDATRIDAEASAVTERLLGFDPAAVGAVRDFLENAPRFQPERAGQWGAGVLCNVLASR